MPQGPVWQRCVHGCLPHSSGFSHVSKQIGTSSVHGRSNSETRQPLPSLSLPPSHNSLLLKSQATGWEHNEHIAAVKLPRSLTGFAARTASVAGAWTRTAGARVTHHLTAVIAAVQLRVTHLVSRKRPKELCHKNGQHFCIHMSRW